MAMKKWSEEAWSLGEPIYKAITEFPFVRELAAGTLSRERFMFYLRQDAMYVDNYIRVLAHVASRLSETAMVEDFLKFALDGVMVERALHKSYLGEDGLAGATPTAVNLLYMDHETSLGLAPVEVEAAGILPCFWVYQKVGESILAGASKDNPYYHWIETYGDPAFEVSTRRAIEICDTLAERASAETRRQMTSAYLRSTRFEQMFWESAYRLDEMLPY